ncbi:uncharacterized protein TNCV_3064851 [Trichonephila clavipes]|nr:uncharacterized protein TNCV_3064851 [Trichonephila clavipes]
MHVKLGLCLEQTKIMIGKYLRKEDFKIYFGNSGKWNVAKKIEFELYQTYKESDSVNFIKIQLIKYAGDAVRMDENHITKKVFNAQAIGTRRKGRPNLRWIDMA